MTFVSVAWPRKAANTKSKALCTFGQPLSNRNRTKWQKCLQMDNNLILFMSQKRPWVLDVDEFGVTTLANPALIRIKGSIEYINVRPPNWTPALLLEFLTSSLFFWLHGCFSWSMCSMCSSDFKIKNCSGPASSTPQAPTSTWSTSFLEVGDTMDLPKMAISVEPWFSWLL